MSHIALKTRRAWAEAALLEYNSKREGRRELVDTIAADLTDLLTDLMHYCESEKIDLSSCLLSAHAHAQHESRRAAGLRLVSWIDSISRMDTATEIQDRFNTTGKGDDDMSGDDACDTLSGLIESARNLLQVQPCTD